MLPIIETELQLDQLLEETARRLFEALGLKITYNMVTTRPPATHPDRANHRRSPARRTPRHRAQRHPANDKDQVNAANGGPGPILCVPLLRAYSNRPGLLEGLVSALERLRRKHLIEPEDPGDVTPGRKRPADDDKS